MDDKKLKILIVDDEPAWTDFLVKAFTRHGFECRACLDVDEGLKTIEEWVPDIIISDFTMPRRSGAELFEEVSSVLPELVARGGFVFLTGSPEEVRRLVEDERVHILQKPYPIKKLLSLLRSVSN